MRRLIVLSALVAMSAPALAQSSDPDKNVAGGVTAKGWTGRTDRANQKIENTKFADMGGGFHVTAGPHAIYWNPANTAKMEAKGYTVKGTFGQVKASAHPEAYGLFIGGSDLAGPNQNYLYFVVRQDGRYMIRHRYHEDVHTLADWTPHPSVKAMDAGGKATNELAISVGPEKTSFMVNGAEVTSLPTPQLVGPQKLESTSGLYGIRVGHNLEVHVGGFGMTPNK
jgi:hypothetical protein